MWPDPLETADLVRFTEEIVNEKLNFLSSGTSNGRSIFLKNKLM